MRRTRLRPAKIECNRRLLYRVGPGRARWINHRCAEQKTQLRTRGALDALDEQQHPGIHLEGLKSKEDVHVDHALRKT